MRALANQEREVQVQRLGRAAKTLLLSLATLMTFAAVSLLVTDHLYRPDAFVIDQMKLQGQFQYVAPERVQEVVFEKPLGNFFSIKLNDIKQRVQDMPWVQHADVRRQWPHTLLVRVKEHRPIMRWQTIGDKAQGKTNAKTVEQWVSSSGEIISVDKPLNRFSSALLKGSEHDARELLLQTMKWQKQLAVVGLQVQSVTLSPSQAWSLTLTDLAKDTSFELLLGRQNAEQRMTRFQTLFDSQLKRESQRLIRVDARYPDGLAVEAEKIVEDADEPEAVAKALATSNTHFIDHG